MQQPLATLTAHARDSRVASALVRCLRSPGVARAILVYLGVYVAVAAWLPWTRPGGGGPPGWAQALLLERPFSSPFFLVGGALLFASTLACTLGKRARLVALSRGELPATALVLESRADTDAFLGARGFRGRGDVRRRHLVALWGGWVLHIGLLVLIGGVLVHQAFHDGGTFEIAEGERLRLSDSGALLSREAGLFASEKPPSLDVALDRFDPFLRQEGYAPDRLSELVVSDGRSSARVSLDRAAGAGVFGATLYQAIPTGLALAVELPGGARAIHLRSERPTRASADVMDPAGRPARFVVETERELADPQGTGAIRILLETEGAAVELAPGSAFEFGGRPARVLAVSRWAGFSYARSPGMAAVVFGFLFILLGAGLLAFPAGVARVLPDGSAQVYVVRGAEVLWADWRAQVSGGRG